MTQIPINYPQIMAHGWEGQVTWSQEQAMLYALAIGLGRNPIDPSELPFVYEAAQKVFPTFAVILAFAGGPLSELAVDQRFMLHGEQSLMIYGQIPPSGQAHVKGRMLGAWDKGAGRGAVFSEEKLLTLAGASHPFARLVTTSFGRAEGGFGSPKLDQPKMPPVPDRAADVTVKMRTDPQQALLYRLCADRNPLHVDPDLAREAGFERPILHGLCTFAITAHAVLREFAGSEVERLLAHSLRFSAPVFPGDDLTVDLWREPSRIAFQVRVEDREVMVITHGSTRLRETS